MPARLGQHFLKDNTVIEKAIRSLNPSKEDVIIEIGPGHGEFTIPLLRAATSCDAQLISIEKDTRLARALHARIQEEKGIDLERFELKEGDARHLLPEIIKQHTSTGIDPAHIKVAGNIPYYITGNLLRTLSELHPHPSITTLMIQEEVAQRVCSKPGSMNRLAASVQFWAKPEIITHVPRKDFSPPPKVDSAIISLTAINDGSSAPHSPQTVTPKHYYWMVRVLFAQPRKTILNNLTAKGVSDQISKEKVRAVLQSLKIEPEIRPERLAISQIALMANEWTKILTSNRE